MGRATPQFSQYFLVIVLENVQEFSTIFAMTTSQLTSMRFFKRAILLLVFLCTTWGCTLIAIQEKPYEGSLTITQVADQATWSARRGHQVVQLQNTLFLIGGYSSIGGSGTDSYMEDVWKSEDQGATWQLVTDNAPWHGRWGHAVTVLDNTIYLSGGFYVDEHANDDDSTKRGYAKDIWKSTNGKDWQLVTDNAPWLERMGHAMVSDSAGSLYILGGVQNSRNYLGDMWVSADKGSSWSRIAQSGDLPFGNRGFSSVLVEDDVLMLFGGNTAQPHYTAQGERNTLSDLFCWDMTKPVADASSWKNFMYNARTTNANAPSHIYRWKGTMITINNTLWILQGQAFESNEFYTSISTSVYSFSLPELLSAVHASTGSGGSGSTPSPNSLWQLDSLTAPVSPRYGYHAVSLGDSGLLIGGQSGKGLKHDVWRLK